jgi:hypothetical protein
MWFGGWSFEGILLGFQIWLGWYEVVEFEKSRPQACSVYLYYRPNHLRHIVLSVSLPRSFDQLPSLSLGLTVGLELG